MMAVPARDGPFWSLKVGLLVACFGTVSWGRTSLFLWSHKVAATESVIHSTRPRALHRCC